MFKRKQILMVLIIVLMLVFSRSYHVKAGELVTFQQFGTHFTINSNEFSYYVGIHGHLVNPGEFDNIVMKNPTGTTILDIKNNISSAFEFEDNGDFFANSNEFYSKVPGGYTVTVTNSSGISESITLNVEESDFSSAAPIIITPGNYSIITDVTPTLSWEPFASPERSTTESLSYFGYYVEIESNESDESWRAGVSGNVTSVIYNFNGTADQELKELIPGKYEFILNAIEDRIKGGLIYSRVSRRIIEFTVPGVLGDINGDGRVGLEEAIYALQVIAQQPASFSYDIDRFRVVGGPAGNSTFIDEFDDGEEPPSGPSGSLTYNLECSFPFSATAESGGLLTLNKNDACECSKEFFFEPILKDSNFNINSGVGGSIEGNFRFTNGITRDSGVGILLFSNDINGGSDLESLYMFIWSDHNGCISATFDLDLGDEEILISETDITNSLIGISDITMRMAISPHNVITASLDFGSDGTFDLSLPGSHTLTFMSGISGYSGGFDAAWEKNGRVGLEEAIYALQVVAGVKTQ